MGQRLIEKLLGWWAAVVQRFALTVILLSAAATVAVGAWFLDNLRIQTDTEDMLDEDLPFRKLRDEMKAAFPGLSDTILVVVENDAPHWTESAAARLAERIRAEPGTYGRIFDPRSHPFFRRNGLLYLSKDELLGYVRRLGDSGLLLTVLGPDPSLRGLARLVSRAATDIQRGGTAPPGLAWLLDTSVTAAKGQGTVSWRERLDPDGWEPTARRRIIVVRPTLDYTALAPAREAMHRLRALAEELGLGPDPVTRVRLSGPAALNSEELTSVKDGLGLAGILSLVLVVTILTAGLRSLRLVGAVAVTLVMGLIWTAGFAIAAFDALNIISVSFAVLFVGLSVDYGIHFCLRFREEVLAGADPADAMRDAITSTGGVLILCAVTGLLAFYAFVPTAYVAVAQLGLIAGTGLLIGLFANLTVLPALILLIGPTIRRGPTGGGPIGRFLRLAPAHPRIVIAGALVLAVLGTYGSLRARFDFDPLNLKDPGTESVSTLLELMDDPRASPYAADLLAGSPAEAEELSRRLEALPEVRSARWIGDYLPANQKEKLPIIALIQAHREGRAAEPPLDRRNRGAAARELSRELDMLYRAAGAPSVLRGAAGRLRDALGKLSDDGEGLEDSERRIFDDLERRLEPLRGTSEVTLENLPKEIREREMAPDGRTRVTVVPEEDLRDPAALHRFVAATKAVTPRITGWPVVILEGRDTVLGAFRQAAITAAVLIAILLLVVLRNVVDAALVFAPLLLAALLAGASTVVLDQPFNFANVIVLPLLFGLGVDSGIHLVLRAREEGKVGALLRTSTPSAVLLSALTTIGSFASIALSSHRGMSSMGVLLAVAISLTLFCTLVVLPALMALRRS